MDLTYREIRKEDDAALAAIIRKSLEENALDIPGTAYFDTTLDHLSEYYLSEPAKRFYYVVAGGGEVLGGVGLDSLPFLEDCAELQKLYLADRIKGRGVSLHLIALLEDKARSFGYRRMYLETHSNLRAAIHVYEKCGYHEIGKPEGAVHATMDHFYLKELF